MAFRRGHAEAEGISLPEDGKIFTCRQRSIHDIIDYQSINEVEERRQVGRFLPDNISISSDLVSMFDKGA